MTTPADSSPPDNVTDVLLAAALRDAQGLMPGAPLPAPGALPGYEFRRFVKRGGQGAVYEGVHAPTGRRVAIKLLHETSSDGGSTDRMRFEREMRLVNEIEHPGVVPVRDHIEADGRAWHVMDFIEGEPLDVFMALRRPALRETLALLASIAEIVDAAHLRGVIHRDLKPGNILVDESGHPHVLDFGLAKRVIGSAELVSLDLTASGHFVGSLAWASPEQAEGRSGDVDLRTDVYALGVIAYHALVGESPYPVDGPLRATLEHIAHTDPAPLRRARKDIDTDTETIVLKCLQKEPSRRYQSAGEVARDLRRRLSGDPIAARGDSSLYVLGKLLRRHRAVAGVAAAFVALLVTGTIVLLIWYREAARQAEIANAVVGFFVEDLIGEADPLRGAGPNARLIDIVDEAAQSLEGRFGDAQVDAFVRRELGSSYRELAALDKADVLLTRSLATYAKATAPSHPDRLKSAMALARLRVAQGRANEAELLLRDALRAAGRRGSDDAIVLDLRENLGLALAESGRLDAALIELNEVIALRRAAQPPQPIKTFNAVQNAAAALSLAGRSAEAEPLYREALDGLRAELGDGNPRSASAMANLASNLISQQRFEEARPLIDKSLAIRTSTLGPEHPGTLASLTLLGTLANRIGDGTSAATILQDVLGRHLRRGDAGTPHVLAIQRELGMMKFARGDIDGALTDLRAAFDGLQASRGRDDAEALEAQRLLARVLRAAGKANDAEPLLRDAVERLRRVKGSSDATTLLAETGLGLTLVELDRAAEAAKTIDDTYARAVTALGADDPRTLIVADGAYAVHRGAGNAARAESLATTLADAHARGVRAPGNRALWLARRADALLDLGRRDEAATDLRGAESALNGAEPDGSTAATIETVRARLR